MRFYYMKRIIFCLKGHAPSLRSCFCKKTWVIFAFLLFCTIHVKGQNDGNISMYWAVPTAYNPATAGSDSAVHIAAFDRMQWVGVEGAPQTFYASADMPFVLMNKRFGAGVSVLNDKAGLFATTIVGAQGSYSRRVKGGRLAIGIQAGMVNQAFKGGDIYIPDGDAWEPGDDMLPRGDVSGMSLDLGFGAFYECPIKLNGEETKTLNDCSWYVGLSAMHLNKAEIDLEEYAYSQQERTYYFLAGCNIPVSRTLFIVQPSVLVRTIGQATSAELTMRATYDHRFWGGVSYRHDDAVVLMVGADIQSIRIGYSYDIGTSALAKASNGSHEVLVTYNLKLDLDKNKRRPTKSIRIL